MPANTAVSAEPKQTIDEDRQAGLLARYRQVRQTTEALCAPLAVEDYVPQSMPSASPAKWHLAHTSWFFETFVLSSGLAGFRSFDERYSYLFNSYYNAVGPRIPRPRRGTLTRPGVGEIYQYRAYVDEHMDRLLSRAEDLGELAVLVELGLHHEQQHQELILTDIKHLFSMNPLRPAYRERSPVSSSSAAPLRWVVIGSGVQHVGHDGQGFAFDNELPRHRVFVESFELASRLVTNGEFLSFVEDRGYERPELWLSDGWDACRTQQWSAPLYWEKQGGQWQQMTLAGMVELDLAQPVCHVSYYEADAFARWAGARLPTEAEWETAANLQSERPAADPEAGHPQMRRSDGNFLESGLLHPQPATGDRDSEAALQLFGDVWEWTASSYSPYPGYRPASGAVGEYNGKFMCNQMVLRGGSCATPRSHIRATYRNFFPPDARWQFFGLRLVRDR